MKRSRHMTNTLFVGSALLLSSCAGYRSPETIEEKIARYQSKNPQVNTVPAIPAMDISYKPKAYRGLASVSKGSKYKKHLKSYSNKRLYFLTLYHQYNYFKKYVPGAGPEVKSCPGFHSSLLKNPADKRVVQHPSPYKEINKQLPLNSKDIAYLYPEFHLPLTRDEVRPKVLDRISDKQELLPKYMDVALSLHTQKLYTEIQELCEHGVSQNYFVFENLITFMKENKGAHKSTFAMQSLLKTSIFSNIALERGLRIQDYLNKKRSPASVHDLSPYEEEILQRLNVDWAREYFQTIANKRLQNSRK